MAASPRKGGLADAITRISSLHGVQVSVGIQGTAADLAADLVAIATDNEFGTARIPSRPFLRTTLDLKGKRWVGGMRAAAKAMARDDKPKVTRILRQLGVVTVGDVQSTIVEHEWVPNAPMTIALKGSDKPLIDTGQLRQSIRAAIEIPGRQPEVIG